MDYILQNERYAGNALLQKRYTTATLPKQQKINRGEREMYYVADSNDAIIPQELFDRAKELRQRRSVGQAVTHGRLCVRMRCSCGSRIRAKQVNGRWYWCCCRHDEKGDCTIKPVPEAQTDEAFCRLFYNARALLLQLAAEQYDAIGNTEYETVRLRRLLTGRKPITEPDAELLQSAVSKIVITNKCMTVTLKNGQAIERRDQM